MTDPEARALDARWMATKEGWRSRPADVIPDAEWRAKGASMPPPFRDDAGVLWRPDGDRLIWWADLRDGATRGVALDEAREAWRDPEIYAAPVEYGPPDWHIWDTSSEQHGPGGRSEEEAIIAAIEAAPR